MPVNELPLEWQIILGDKTIIAHGEHIAHNPRVSGFVIGGGDVDNVGRILCHTCHQRIPLEVCVRWSNIVRLMRHGS